ncbi:MAG: polymer-forming cytoskeletal protein [Bacteroidales bacterium]|nr:polymer-forming cytoskeletal protein [Bacteroidales bacterium]
MANNNTNIELTSRITAGSQFIGEMTTPDSVRIDGTLVGRLKSGAHVVVGEKGVIKGNVYCKTADIYGTLQDGAVYVKEILTLKPGCTVKGDLYPHRIQIEPDVHVDGNCKMISEDEFNKAST